MVTLRINGKSQTIAVPGDAAAVGPARFLGMNGTVQLRVALCGAAPSTSMESRGGRVLMTVAPASAMTSPPSRPSAPPVGQKVRGRLDLEVAVRLLPVGQIMAPPPLLAAIPAPTDTDIDEAMSGTSAAAAPIHPRGHQAGGEDAVGLRKG